MKFLIIILAIARFKPQRGKFTHGARPDLAIVHENVSNPNGVNLHRHCASNGIGGAKVSNPNGVNLHTPFLKFISFFYCFKPQRGKFTLMFPVIEHYYEQFQTPTG